MRTDQALIAELKRIAIEHGGILKPEDVVVAASNDDSPLHHIFEWDDTEAAHQFRLQQARQLIRVTVSHIPSGDGKITMRVFTSLSPDRTEDGGGYRATAEILSNARMRAQLMKDALNEMGSFKRKYSSLTELAEVFAALSKAQRKLLVEIGRLEDVA